MYSRREFLSTSGTIAACGSLSVLTSGCNEIGASGLADNFSVGSASVPTANNKFSASFSDIVAEDAMLRTLGRISFGVRPEDIARAKSIGLSAYVDEQLNPETLSDSSVSTFVSRKYKYLGLTDTQLRNAEKNWNAQIELKESTAYRMINSRRQLFEVMVDFWSNHFSIDGSLGTLNYYKSLDDRDVIRPHAMGYFKDLLHASAKSPAMLHYLNNSTNTKKGPNENYAREIMELHTLGIDGGYSEEDIKEAARSFTGWGIDRKNIRFKFNSRHHDSDGKTIFGLQIPAGQGVEDGEQLIDYLANHPSTADFIATKLVRRFVSDVPPGSLVKRVADEYLSTGGHIPSILRVIFESAEFNSPDFVKFKRPIDYVISAFRVLGVNESDVKNPRIINTLKLMGQAPFEWPTPDGYPDTGEYWNNAQGLASRWAFALQLSESAFRQKNTLLKSWIIDIDSVDSMVTQFSKRILHTDIDENIKNQLISTITENGIPADGELQYYQRVQAAIITTAGLLSMPDFMLR
ncbi:MAG: DUF1800 domain-containing protein [Gammaproteobacteria bacterium]